MGAKILIADDESDIVSMLGSFFESKGFRVLPAFNGAEALKQVEKQPDIILLDINMPGTDGLEVCKRIRDHISCPILFLTARIEDTDKVKGFAVGGDDYIVKPFSLVELEARVRAHLRREARHNFEAQVKFSGDLTIDYSERCLFFGDKRVGLAKKEFDIVELLSQNISRLENYVSSMSNIRRMEDTQPEYKLIDLQPLVSSLYDSAKIICTKNGKELILQNDISVLQLSLDSAFISQVCNNLISNAVRYARTLVTISFTLHDNGLLLSVSDDGNGFDKDSLQKAANPYFTGESNHSEHFGLGLYICKLLCEHHNGYLKIENTATGANVSAYFKSPAL